MTNDHLHGSTAVDKAVIFKIGKRMGKGHISRLTRAPLPSPGGNPDAGSSLPPATSSAVINTLRHPNADLLPIMAGRTCRGGSTGLNDASSFSVPFSSPVSLPRHPEIPCNAAEQWPCAYRHRGQSRGNNIHGRRGLLDSAIISPAALVGPFSRPASCRSSLTVC